MAQPRTPRSPDNLERTRFFARQTLLPDDLGQDPEYLIHKARRHNRVLHGWGIWSGLSVLRVLPSVPKPPGTATADEKKPYEKYEANQKAIKQLGGQIPPDVPLTNSNGTWLYVAPGFGLTPLGDEVYLPGGAFVDTAREIDGGLVTAPASCRALAAAKPSRTGSMVLVVEATEDQIQPVRASCDRCGDSPEQFEFSRLVDTLRFRLLTTDEVKLCVNPYQPQAGDTTDPDVRRVKGCVCRVYVELALIAFEDGGTLKSVAYKSTNGTTTVYRDWFALTAPATPSVPPAEGV
jgi:hypothetical protein